MWTQGFIYIHKLKINLLRKDCRAEKRGTRVRHSRHKHGGDTHKQEWLDHLWQPWRSWIMYTLAVGNMTLTIPWWVTLIWERQTKTYERKTPTIRAGEMEPVWQKSTDSPTAHTSESCGPQRTVSVSTFSPLSLLCCCERVSERTEQSRQHQKNLPVREPELSVTPSTHTNDCHPLL